MAQTTPTRSPHEGPETTAHKPFVPEGMSMREYTLGTVLLGLGMTVVLGAANLYLGLKAGQTIAATYPAAVISMAVLRLRKGKAKGTILQENLARTAGSIGESVAAGAAFTIPAFLIAGVWPSFAPGDAYWKSTVLMVVGSVLGVLFVSLVRRGMVEDRTLPFPESVAAAEIHKAGQRGADAAKYLFYNMFVGAGVLLGSTLKLWAFDRNFFPNIGTLGKSVVRLGAKQDATSLAAGGITKVSVPDVSAAYIGVGYIIGPGVAAMNFAGAVLAWGVLVPLFIYFLGPELHRFLPAGALDNEAWDGTAVSVFKFIVRPIAVGGMLVGAGATLFRMRKSLSAGLSRAFGDLAAKAKPDASIARTERYMSSKTIFGLIAIVFVGMIGLYISFAGTTAGVTAALVMLIAGFFFCTVSGYLVGLIGSSNNPISGLTLSALIVAALLMVALGVSGQQGVLAVLGVAAVVCVAAAVAGELLQDFKVGYLLGGTPRTIQIVELIAVVVAAMVMYFPLMWLYQGNINSGGTGFGDPKLSAPQASLMAFIAQGIVGGDMAWPLVIVGIMMGFAMILLQVRSPMLVSVGMYLPFGTTAAIFVGGIIRWMTDSLGKRRGLNEAQVTRVTNIGILIASGFIAGEALLGLVTAALAGFEIDVGKRFGILEHPSYLVSIAVMASLALILIFIPLSKAGDPKEPAPPSAMM